MQTFLPYSNFAESAKILDRYRLGKQRVECLQIFKTLKGGPFKCYSCKSPVTHFNPYKSGYHCYYCEAPLKKRAWYNHTAVQMWKGYERGLLLYQTEICNEWTRRGYKDTCLQKSKDLVCTDGPILLPDLIGNPEFHKSHMSNLVRKDPEYYRKFFPDVPNNLPYIWTLTELQEHLST